MATKVSKFGGTSLADARQIKKVREVVRADPERRYVVPSAPGKRDKADHKITDLLYLCHEHAKQRLPFDEVFDLIADRYRGIVRDLGIALDLTPHLDEAKRTIAREACEACPPDYAASRGEYLNGLILADYLGFPFVDAAEVIFFDGRGRLDEQRTYAAIADRVGTLPNAVIPGFYGTGGDGKVKTFSRGGSDVSGAIVACGVGAAVYENWTDVSGLLMADPRVVDNPRAIEVITYRELRELAYMGASVLHDEAIFPVRKAGIPINIRNTNRPDDKGTMIVSDAGPAAQAGKITGIAGKKNFTVIALEKALMNTEIGFGRKTLAVLERHGVSFEHLPSGIDTMSIVIEDSKLGGKAEDVVAALRSEVQPDEVLVLPNMALIATVGRGMARMPGMAARLFGALADEGVNIRMIDQGSGELNIIVGVEATDFERAMRAIYAAFVEQP